MSERVHFRLVYERKKNKTLSIDCNTTSALMYSKPHAHVFTTKFSLTFTTAMSKKSGVFLGYLLFSSKKKKKIVLKLLPQKTDDAILLSLQNFYRKHYTGNDTQLVTLSVQTPKGNVAGRGKCREIGLHDLTVKLMTIKL